MTLKYSAKRFTLVRNLTNIIMLRRIR